MDLLQFNHWWRDGFLRKELIGRKRKILQKLISFLPKRQILLLKGLRRVGKTTLIYQLIDHLINEGILPIYIFYFSFDVEVAELEEVLVEYQKRILHKDISSDSTNRYYIFLDEVHKLKGWANQLKVFYDLYPSLKFIISGSASINIDKQAKESLAGRLYDFYISPLDFNEYLEFKNIRVDTQNIDLYRSIIEPRIFSYLQTSGFPEMVDEEDKEVISRYFRQSILERIIYQDLPQSFIIREPELLFRIVKVIAHRPGLLMEYNTLASEFKRDKRTIAQYCDYLRYVFLVKPLYHFSQNMLVSERRLKKYYLSFPAFTYALSEPHIQIPEGILMEHLFVSIFDAKFFYRSTTKEEVDIVQTEHEVLPIEIKYKSQILPKDIKGIKSFIRKYKVKEGIIISKNEERKIEVNEVEIKIVPYWKMLVERSK